MIDEFRSSPKNKTPRFLLKFFKQNLSVSAALNIKRKFSDIDLFEIDPV